MRESPAVQRNLDAELARARADAFQQTSEMCAERSGVDIVEKPGTRVNIFGTAQKRFDFEKCMARNGQATEMRTYQ